MGCSSSTPTTPVPRGIRAKIASNTLLTNGSAGTKSPRPRLQGPGLGGAVSKNEYWEQSGAQKPAGLARGRGTREFDHDMASHCDEATRLPILNPAGIVNASRRDNAPARGVVPKSARSAGHSSLTAPGAPTSRVHKNPQGWQEEAILFPNEGVRFLMQELWDAIYDMDPLPAWKWQILEVWYQEYFYDVIHHQHEAEEQIYLPWIQTRISVPTKVTAKHPELLRTMDELRNMIRAGSVMAVGERAHHLNQVRTRILDFVADMLEHLADQEEIMPCLLREAGFTQEEEENVVWKIIQSLGSAGNRTALPPSLHAFECWAGPEKVEAFVSGCLPLPTQFLYQKFWLADFQQRHIELLASLAEGVKTNPFGSNA